MIKSVVWASLLDYPGHVCTSLFFDGCNFNCEYCYNKDISKLDTIHFKNDILPKLLERKELVSYIILSGGECTISNDFQAILDILYENSFIIGIHTNGSRPDIILKNIDKISFIGMDIKNEFNNYNETCKTNVDIDKIEESIRIITDANINYEFRTTVYPKDIKKENCINIAKCLKKFGVKEYVLQKYRKVEELNTIPFSDEDLEDVMLGCNNMLYTTIKNS